MDKFESAGNQTSGQVNWVKEFETNGLAVAETIKSIIRTLESIGAAFARFRSTLSEQRDSIVEFKHTAEDKIRPLASQGQKLLVKGREHPLPIVLGGLAVVGGIAILAYYLSQEESSASITEAA